MLARGGKFHVRPALLRQLQIDAGGSDVDQCASGIHRQVRVSLEGLDEALATSPVRLSAMGRGLRADPGAFLASAASGVHACRLLD